MAARDSSALVPEGPHPRATGPSCLSGNTHLLSALTWEVWGRARPVAGEAPAHSPDTPVFTPTWRAGPAWRPGHHVSPGSSPAWPFGPHPRPAHPSLPQKPWAHRCPHLQGRGPAEAHAGAQEAGAAARQGTSGSLVPAAPPGRGTGSGWACPLGLQSPRNGGEGHSWRKAPEPGFHALRDGGVLGPGKGECQRVTLGSGLGRGRGDGSFAKMGLCGKRPWVRALRVPLASLRVPLRGVASVTR